MFHKSFVLRIVILLAVMPAVLLSSCTDEGREAGKENLVVLSRDTVAYDHTGQFVAIESSGDWSITLSYEGTDADWAKVSPESGSGSTNSVMLTYSENGSRRDREVAVNVSFSDGELVTVTLVQTGDPNASGGEDPDPDPDIEGLITATIDEFLKAEPCDTVWYKLTGTITDIESDVYGNLTVKDETGQAYIYGLTAEGPLSSNDKSFSSIGLKEGDILTLATVRGEYNGEPQGGGQSTPAYYISHKEGEDPGPWPGLESDPYQSGWLELPAVEDEEGRAFVYHTAEVNGQRKRNYSMLYDAAGRIALWVAYPFCNDYTGDSGRTDAWGFDPKIPDEYEPVLHRGWPEGGFDRGHQIPSGSRTVNRAMNSQTFYFTNMTAQNSRLNQDVWATLENMVRGYASSCDTLYVVTGPIFDSEDPAQWRYTEDNAGNPVAVPDGYFKVLLKYKVSSATYYSIAFVYENRDYGRHNPVEEDLHTVSEVEEMTGFTFFNNLPQSVAASVKDQLEPNRWGF